MSFPTPKTMAFAKYLDECLCPCGDGVLRARTTGARGGGWDCREAGQAPGTGSSPGAGTLDRRARSSIKWSVSVTS